MVWLLLLACQDRELRGDFIAQYTLGEQIPNVLDVRWDNPEDGVASVIWGLDGALDHQTAPMAVSAGEPAHIRVLGPPSGEEITIRLVLELPDGEELLGPQELLTIPYAPAELPAFYVSGAPSSPGWVLTALIDADAGWLLLLDSEGRPVWYVQMPSNQNLTSVRLTPDGAGVLAMGEGDVGEVEGNVLFQYGWDGHVQRRMVLPLGHHDFTQLPDGRIAWLQREIGQRAVGEELLDVVGDAVRITDWTSIASSEGPPTFSLLAAGVQDQTLCGDQHLTQTVDEGTYLDWSHANSISYDPDEDALLMLTHHIDQIVVFSPEDGELLQRIEFEEGDPDHDEDEPWSHAHASSMRRDQLLLFDNGTHYTPQRSRVVGYTVDLDTGDLTQTLSLWEPEGRMVSALGDAIVLPWGNTLVSWSTLGRIDELDDSGAALWTLSTAVGAGTGRLVWLDSLYGY